MTAPRRILVVTGTRAEYGLLRTVLDGIDQHSELHGLLVVTGAHLLPEVNTIAEIRADRTVDAEVQMQSPGREGRMADVEAVGRGIQGFARAFAHLKPDVVLVLGDRIEVFAAASAASIGGIRVAHLHGGDRAEGVADEAMRHAVTKLSHLHLPATSESAERIRRMGEPSEMVVEVGSPAADSLDGMGVMSEEDFSDIGSPRTIFLMHGVGASDEEEHAMASEVLASCVSEGPVLALAPNTDPGSAGIRKAIKNAPAGISKVDHLPRDRFIGALRRVDALVGNSSAGLIEASIVGCPAINIGQRQGGRERPGNVLDLPSPNATDIRGAIESAKQMSRDLPHPYGDGRCGERVAEVLARLDLSGSPRKRNAY